MLTQMEYDALRPFRDVRPDLTIVCTEWVITIPGRAALESFEDRQEHHRKQARQQRFQNQVSVASVLVPTITFILGLIVEHGLGLVGTLLDLFR